MARRHHAARAGLSGRALVTGEAIAAARELHRAGKLDEAVAAYAALLDAEPGNAELWHLRALAEQQKGRAAQARDCALRALAIDPAQAMYHLTAGHAAHDAGDGAGAVPHYAHAAALRPDWGAAWASLGVARLESGDADGASEALARAVAIDPRVARWWNNLGLAELARDRIAEAEAAFRHAIEGAPGYALAHFNLARLAERGGRGDEALAQLDAAIASAPRMAEALLLRARLLRRRRDPRADAAHRAALDAAPADPGARIAWAEYLQETGRTPEAREEFRRAEQLDPKNLRAALGARLALPAVYTGLAHLEASRQQYTSGLEELHGAVGRFLAGARPDSPAEASWTNFHLAYQGRNDRALQSRYGDLIDTVLRDGAPEFFRDLPRRARGKRLRVGFCSHFFFNCTAGRYFASWILDLDRARFESVVFYTNPWVADDTRAIAAAADRFFHVAGVPLHEVARRIAAEDLDVLVYPELGMYADTFALAALRLAPLQVAGWGHPTTTGLASIDVFLSCAVMEPGSAEEAYRERLALLPGLGTRYAQPRIGAPATRADFGLPDDATLYLLPQSLFKIHPDNDALVADVLSRDASGVLVLFAGSQEPLTEAFLARQSVPLQARGIDPGERVFLMRYMDHGRYLQLNALCDVMLDTLHWSGGNTSLDALAMGLPVVTLPGDLMRGRQSAGMLGILGVEELVAGDREDFVAKAVAIASDRAHRDALSRTIVSRLGLLFDRSEPVRAFEEFLAAAAAEPPSQPRAN
jgi:protein O-GlcNAc transferase